MRVSALRVAMVVLAAVLVAGCDKPAFIELDPKEHTFKRVGEDVWWKAHVRTQNKKLIHNATVTWSSADPKVVTVDAKGRAKAVAPGHTTITARIDHLSADVAVDVQGVGKVTVEPAEGLTLDARGEGKPIVMKVFDLAGHPMTDRHPVARCLDDGVCRVFPTGVHGVDSGETTLEVSCEGAKTSMPIKVLPTEEERLAKGIDVDKPAKPGKKK